MAAGILCVAEIPVRAACPCSNEHLAAVRHLLPEAEHQQQAPTTVDHHRSTRTLCLPKKKWENILPKILCVLLQDGYLLGNTAGKTTKTAGLQGKERLDLYNYPSLWMSNKEHSRDQARAEAGELPEEDRLMWANTVKI